MSRTAVIGAGVAGLTAAYLLSRRDDVTLFEAADRAGGHAHTQFLGADQMPVDTGFMVFNSGRYPQLSRLFSELGVRSRPTEMSMSVQCDGCGLAYLSGSPLRSVPAFAAGADPSRWQRTRDELALFADTCDAILDSHATADGPHEPIGQLLAEAGVSPFTVAHTVAPIISAVWSCPARTALDYPANFLLVFLDNHGLLAGRAATRWRTVVGGSASYVQRAAAHVSETLLGTPVRMMRRTASGVEVLDSTDRVRTFERAVIAVHPAEALAILADPTEAETRVLAALQYEHNIAVLHTDTSVLPRDAQNWASWNVRLAGCTTTDRAPSIHYDLTRLQGLGADERYLLSLNPSVTLDRSRVIESMTYEHPVYTAEAHVARQSLPSLDTPSLAFAGAYHGWGFHEDGCASGVRAAAALGVSW